MSTSKPAPSRFWIAQAAAYAACADPSSPGSLSALRPQLKELLLRTLPDLAPAPDLLAAATETEDPGLVGAMIDHFGPAQTDALLACNGRALRDPVTHGRIAILEAFVARGCDLSGPAARMFRCALRNADPAYLAFIERHFPDEGLMTQSPDDDLLLRLPPAFLPETLAWLEHWQKTDPRRLARSFFLKQTYRRSFKLFALALLICENCAAVYPAADRALVAGTWIGDLLDATQSAHGRLRLRRLEPSLEEVITRPQNSCFFGHSSAEYRTLMARELPDVR